ncbi:hypothetical protein [Oceanobacter mangrovi]|uniref:hypothetical protein n=1 Tax=Oceanobacter mangrovi TaxID=2862510 RepID=UPI001C8E914B|nr:hypothetical protein [Oceanobacter mangrovi]
MSAHPLIQRLLDEFHYPLLASSTIDEFVGSHEFSVLFFTEDPTKVKESLDVAVVLPELVAVFPQLAAAVIDRDSEKQLQGRYHFVTWPALVFLKRGDFLGSIIKIQNWDDYLQQIPDILKRQPQAVVAATEA